MEYGQASFNKLFGRYKRQAVKRGLLFSLTKEEFRNLTSSHCHYCKIEPSSSVTDHDRLYGDYMHNGIDRLDNAKGYELSNTITCCGICNRAKMTTGYYKFLEWIERIQSNASHVNEIYEPVNRPIRIIL